LSSSNLFFITNFGKELGEYKVDLVGVHEVKCDKGDNLGTWDYFSFYVNKTKIFIWEEFLHQRVISAVKRLEFVSNSMSYVVQSSLLRRHCLNVHVPTEEKIDDSKDCFREELERGFDNFSK
jgi:hypothetical protein